jgi:hypothetical protein
MGKQETDSAGKGSVSFWSVVAIGIGGMVGGGIFAVLGFAVQLGKGATPVSFLVAGIVAVLTAYSYARMSVRYPSEGGTVEFLNKGFGPGFFTGGLNVLLWISYVVMLSLYAYAFGHYGASFFSGNQTLWTHLLISAGILLFAGLNALGSTLVGRAEKAVVAIKLSILFLFIAVGIWSIDGGRLSPSAWGDPVHIVAGGMVIFLAYEGFELIANTANDVVQPKKTLPRAFFTAVVFVIGLYVVISMVTVGNLAIADIVSAKDYALAEAARPFLGHAGFVLIAIAALLSTGSAINATLYGTARVSYIIAKDGELPRQLEKKVWHRHIEGLLITAALALVVANLFDVSSISMMGSAGFLIIFAMVNVANARRCKETDSNRWIALLGASVCLGSLVALIYNRAVHAPEDLAVLVVMLAAAFGIEWLYRRMTGRELKETVAPGTRHEARQD